MEIGNLPYTGKAIAIAFVLYALYMIVVGLVQRQRHRYIARKKGCLPAPALPQKDKILGSDVFRENMAAFKDHRFLDLNKQRFEKMGVNTFEMYALGRNIIFTIEPENLKTIQALDFKKWSFAASRKNGFRPLFGDGIFTTDGAQWQHSRDMLRPNFVRSQFADLPMLEKHVQHFIAAIPSNGSTVDLSELFFRLTIDSATELLFGESTESLARGSTEGFAESFTRAQTYVANAARLGWWAKLFPANKQFGHDKQFVHDFVDRYVEKGLARRSQLLASEKSQSEERGRYVFIDELVRQTTDRIQIRSELLNILLAGRDTTASLLTNIWFVLSKQPEVWTKLQAEVATLQGTEPTFEQLKNLKYLKAIINESLRLHPVIPINGREAQEDTTLPTGGGSDGSAPLFLKKGSAVAYSIYAMHRRKDLYGPDADEFRPERWLDDVANGQKGLRPGWEYLPFNGGPRICIGQQLALTEASYITVRLCQAFGSIESRDSEGWNESLTLTCVNLNGAKVALST